LLYRIVHDEIITRGRNTHCTLSDRLSVSLTPSFPQLYPITKEQKVLVLHRLRTVCGLLLYAATEQVIVLGGTSVAGDVQKETLTPLLTSPATDGADEALVYRLLPLLLLLCCQVAARLIS